jgi:hypothetical protein
MGWAARSNPTRDARLRIERLKRRIARRQVLSDADVALLARCGPKMQAYVGYVPIVKAVR